MAERSNAAVLKTVDSQGSGGSNPSLSALIAESKDSAFFVYLINKNLLHFKPYVARKR